MIERENGSEEEDWMSTEKTAAGLNKSCTIDWEFMIYHFKIRKNLWILNILKFEFSIYELHRV